jgi:uncharacterized protein
MKNLILHTEQIKDNTFCREFEENAQAFPIIAEMVKRRECEFLEPLKIRVKAFKIRELYEVEGNFQTQIRLPCSRCLKAYNTAFGSDFELTYTRDVPGLMDVLNEEEIELRLEEIGLLYFRGEEIDLQQGIQEQIVMAFPIQPLCAVNCKGLCPQCGADRNQGDCGCKRGPSSNKFAVLKNLKLDKP